MPDETPQPRLSAQDRNAILGVIQRRGDYGPEFRDLCLHGIEPDVRDKLPRYSEPGLQLEADLNHLSDPGKWTSDPLPTWLSNADRITRGLQGADIFRRLSGSAGSTSATGAGVPLPRAPYISFGQRTTLQRIGEVVEALLESDESGVAVVIFQANIELDRAESFLICLREDRDQGLWFYLPPDARVWANWETGRRIDFSVATIPARIDPSGERRAKACFSQVNRRIIQSQTQRVGTGSSANPIEALGNVVQELEYTNYILLHFVDSTAPCEGLSEHLEQYLRLWQLEPLKSKNGLARFLLLIHVHTSPESDNPAAQENLAQIRRAVRRVVPELDTDDDVSIFQLTGKLLDHVQRPEEANRTDAMKWREGFEERVNGIRNVGGLTPERALALVQEARVVVDGLMAQKGALRMREIEAALMPLTIRLAELEAKYPRP